jgi:broad specificity phosphatase PhoE
VSVRTTGNIGAGRARSLVLIRHARVRPEPGKPHRLWGLTEEGRRAAATLALDEAVRDVTLFASSAEPKAVETAAAVATGRPVVEIEDLGELDRSAAGWLASEQERMELVRAIFENPTTSVRGCESAADALARFTRGVDTLVAEHPEGGLAVVTHGTVLALYMAHLRGEPTASIESWRGIGLPDLALVDHRAGAVIRNFAGGTG